ncbi:MAG: tRNA (adenosine(37)-N6)-dimethylallyltransferase MiaA [Candidatus Peribacteraceae bacterium]|nr:tRNA (adenosine(37)-N6)-dimethylallyltransferase MiaA [Candidatus Peribacteraceae bacterium]MBP9851014.1 tRNA (adenosine(37)-N6)-dimethylallyltransferase MiaA [Candidatus Peribacteraceae bacterium]
MRTFPDQRRQILEAFLASGTTKPLIVIIGPTASGKTAFSIGLAKELQNLGKTAEVMNADSRQFYRGFDIGTAKITSEEKQGIDHHLIDVLGSHEDCTIAWYKQEAERVITEIHVRGHIPLLVGGSMLYVASLVDGFEPIAPGDPAIRARLDAEYDLDGGKTLYQRLSEIDPETAASFPMQNKVYVVRAMEIYESTGKTKSEQKRKSPSGYDLLIFGMDVPKEILHEKIAARTKAMLSHGWIDEVRALKERGVTLTDPAMKSVGYREIFEAIEKNEIDVASLAEIIDSRTRAYAKRHLTWWKRDPRVRWIRP